MDSIKKRGKNFTSEEISLLLGLVEAKKSVIENKASQKSCNEAKNTAWQEIARLFNTSSNEARTPTQIKNFYENLKRRSKKSFAEGNKKEYLNRINEGETFNLEILKQKAMDEKKEMKKTGGGPYNCTLTNSECRVISLLGDTIRPLENKYDDANVYFDDPIDPSQCPASTSPLPLDNVNEEMDSNEPFPTSQEEAVIPTQSSNQKKKTVIHVPKKKIPRKNLSSESIRRKYYIQKLKNAKLQEISLRTDIKIKQKQLAML